MIAQPAPGARVQLTFSRGRNPSSLERLLSPVPGVEMRIVHGRITAGQGRVELELRGASGSIDTTLALYRERQARVERR